MDGRVTQTNCDEAREYVVPNVFSPRDLVSRPDNMDETVLSSFREPICLNYKNVFSNVWAVQNITLLYDITKVFILFHQRDNERVIFKNDMVV